MVLLIDFFQVMDLLDYILIFGLRVAELEFLGPVFQLVLIVLKSGLWTSSVDELQLLKCLLGCGLAEGLGCVLLGRDGLVLSDVVRLVGCHLLMLSVERVP